MLSGFIRSQASNRNIETAAYHFSDFLERNPLFSNPVIRTADGAFLERQPVDTGGVESMDRRPSIKSIADIGRDTLLSRNSYQVRNEAMIPVAVHSRRKPDNRSAYAALG
jgi:hypothetical protein